MKSYLSTLAHGKVQIYPERALISHPSEAEIHGVLDTIVLEGNLAISGKAGNTHFLWNSAVLLLGVTLVEFSQMCTGTHV